MKTSKVTYYNVPDEYWYRIHFVRPRFKNNIENVLLYMATECSRFSKLPCKEYNKKYLNAIRMFPGNVGATDKTLQNWRTEIPALFGFYTENKTTGYTETSRMATFLYENQDLTQFLRFFLYSFQFPGGHLKSKDIKELIERSIRFKPAKLIINVLLEGNRILASEGSEKQMSLSAEEATYCIFNDSRVTSGKTSPSKIARTILDNRKNRVKYYNRQDPKVFSLTGKARTKGDVTRYAGDIMDYMEIANLLKESHGYYSLRGNEYDTIMQFAQDETFFKGYEHLYNKSEITLTEIADVEPLWFEYVNDSLTPNLFKTEIHTIFEGEEEIDVVFGDRIKEVVTGDDKTTKDIGNLGEAIIYGHERMRLKINGYEDMLKMVRIVDSSAYHPGYDIESMEADGTDKLRYIEVKTTISKRKIEMYGFHMSTHEWIVAGTNSEHYCVYRLMLSERNKTLYILRDPVRLYKNDLISGEPRDGMELSFDASKFEQTKVLQWQN